MIDIHAHILPEVDDGASDLESAVLMAEMAVESGVQAIIATPHSNLRPYGNYWDSALRAGLETLQQEVTAAGIPLKIYPGMEIFGTPDVPELLRKGKLTTLANSGYLLVEFPFRHYSEEATEVLSTLCADGYRPIVAHPERYQYVQDNPAVVNRWVGMGCLLQANRGSLLGRFGRTAQMLSLALVDRGLTAFVASDAHSPVMRTTWMADVQELLCEEFSEDIARLLLYENPLKVLRNADIRMKEPVWF